MFQWLYSSGNLAGKSVHPVDGKVYPNFLLLHPRDHASHNVSLLPVKAKKSTFSWFEFPLTGCKAQPGNASEPHVCPQAPAANPGFVATSDPAAVAKAERTNATSVALSVTPKGIQYGIQGCNEQGRCAYVVKSRHAWVNTPQGVQVTTTHQFGLDIGLAASKINPRILKAWSGSDNPSNKCQRAVLHSIEEFGALQYWLPQAFKAATTRAVAAGSA